MYFNKLLICAQCLLLTLNFEISFKTLLARNDRKKLRKKIQFKKQQKKFRTGGENGGWGGSELLLTAMRRS
jgi:hypothetical protein